MSGNLDPKAAALTLAARQALVCSGVTHVPTTTSRLTWSQLIRVANETGIACSELAASAVRIESQQASA